LSTPSAAADTSGNVLGELDFLPNLKDPHARLCDERQYDDKHRFALPSTRLLQYEQVEVPYPGSPSSPGFSEIFILKNLTYASHQRKHNYHHAAPMLNPERRGFTLRWEYMLLSGYISSRRHPLSSKIQPVARWDMELNRELTGERGRRCLAKIRFSPTIPLTSSFVVMILHLLSSHIHQSLSDNE
jgi:hypothetical protein